MIEAKLALAQARYESKLELVEQFGGEASSAGLNHWRSARSIEIEIPDEWFE